MGDLHLKRIAPCPVGGLPDDVAILIAELPWGAQVIVVVVPDAPVLEADDVAVVLRFVCFRRQRVIKVRRQRVVKVRWRLLYWLLLSFPRPDHRLPLQRPHLLLKRLRRLARTYKEKMEC